MLLLFISIYNFKIVWPFGSSKDYFIILFSCLFHFIFFKDQVANECVTEKPDRTLSGLQPHSFGSEPSLSRQRRQKKREQPKHSGEERQVSRDLCRVSHCAAAGE